MHTLSMFKKYNNKSFSNLDVEKQVIFILISVFHHADLFRKECLRKWMITDSIILPAALYKCCLCCMEYMRAVYKAAVCADYTIVFVHVEISPAGQGLCFSWPQIVCWLFLSERLSASGMVPHWRRKYKSWPHPPVIPQMHLHWHRAYNNVVLPLKMPA